MRKKIRVFSNKILNVFARNNWLYSGKDSDRINRFGRQNIIFSQFIATFIPVLIVYVIKDLIAGRTVILYIEITLLVITTLALVLNERGFHLTSRLIEFPGVSLCLFVAASIQPRDAGINLLYVPLIAVTFIVCGETLLKNFLYSLLPFICLIVLEFTHYNLFGSLPELRKEDELFKIMNMFTTFFFVTLILFLSRRMISMSERVMLLQQQELNKLNQELDRFVYSASHDLKSPLASIGGLISLAKMEVKDPTCLNYFDMINERIKKLNDFIISMTDYTRNRHMGLTFQTISLNQLVDEVVDSLKYMQDANRVRVIRDFGSVDFLNTDKSRLSVILTNLITNGVKYHDQSKADLWIKITVTKNEGYIYFIVADNGMGIDAAHQPKIFEMFYRATATSTGSGIGLYIVKESVERLGGTIEMKSVYAEGTSFKLKIPLESTI